MRYSFVPLALAALAAANPMPQGVTSAISPKSSAPAGCSASYTGSFQISTVNVTTSRKRDVEAELVERQAGVLTITLANGILTDSQGRTGYIASNQQFQFDKPAQAGAIYTAGWSVCSNGSLALGGSAIFYQCLSGTFYNLYDASLGGQCSQIYIQVIGGGGSPAPVASSAPATAPASASPLASPVASQRTDGQVTATPAASLRPASQISDGQPQAASAGRVTQISDGQIQATTARSTGRAVSQISDGQPQAPKSTAAAVSQISDGQPQAPKSTAAAVSQISDGQPQAPTSRVSAAPGTASAARNGTVVSATVSTPAAAYTGAAAPILRGDFFGIAAGVVAVALL